MTTNPFQFKHVTNDAQPAYCLLHKQDIGICLLPLDKPKECKHVNWRKDALDECPYCLANKAEEYGRKQVLADAEKIHLKWCTKCDAPIRCKQFQELRKLRDGK